jgi:opacity protein-like surface antigen
LRYFCVVLFGLIRISLIILFSICSFLAEAQISKRNFRQKEVGLFGGGSYYLGDINPRRHFIPSHPAIGGFFRFTPNYRYAFRLGLNYGTVSASDSKSKEPDQLERNLNFRSRIYDAQAIAEFNFVEYRIGHPNHIFTMFVFGGLGFFHMNPQININGDYVNLHGMKTENQSKSYSKYQFSLPFGIGIKWNVTDRIGLGFEWGPRKTFTDYLDDISGSYTVNSLAVSRGILGSMRGNPRSKDWYFFYGFTLNFRLLNKETVCTMMGTGG